MSAVSFLIFAIGVYVIVMDIKMKNTGTIPNGLINNKVNLDRAKDIPGFIKYMFVRNLVFGILICICSALLILNDYGYMTINVYVQLALHILYIAGIIYYARVIYKAQQKYLF